VTGNGKSRSAGAATPRYVTVFRLAIDVGRFPALTSFLQQRLEIGKSRQSGTHREDYVSDMPSMLALRGLGKASQGHPLQSTASDTVRCNRPPIRKSWERERVLSRTDAPTRQVLA
jgi:hypothetical protein